MQERVAVLLIKKGWPVFSNLLRREKKNCQIKNPSQYKSSAAFIFQRRKRQDCLMISLCLEKTIIY